MLSPGSRRYFITGKACTPRHRPKEAVTPAFGVYTHTLNARCSFCLPDIVQPRTPGTGADRSPVGAEGACSGQQRDQGGANVHREALAAAVSPVEVSPVPQFLSRIANPSASCICQRHEPTVFEGAPHAVQFLFGLTCRALCLHMAPHTSPILFCLKRQSMRLCAHHL